MAAILTVTLVSSINDYQKERQFQKLNAQQDVRHHDVKRDGKWTRLDTRAILVGDVIRLQAGGILPCDAIFLQGHDVRCDESDATGVSSLNL